MFFKICIAHRLPNAPHITEYWDGFGTRDTLVGEVIKSGRGISV